VRWPGGAPEGAEVLAPAPSASPPTQAAAAAIDPSLEQARELKPYVAEPSPAVESTHIDRNIEARARAMVAPEQTSAAPAPPAPVSHVAARAFEGAIPALDPPRALEVSVDDELGHPGALPGFGSAMLLRVRFAGGEVPLWSLVAPLIVIGALAAALAAAAVSGAPSTTDSDEPAPAASASALATREASSGPSATPSARPAPAGAPASALTAPAEVEGFDLQPGKYAAKEVLGVAAKRAAREIEVAKQLRAALDRDPGLVEEPRTLSELRRLSDTPETARIVLEAMAGLPAPIAPDLLYEVWTGTVQRNDTTELARALLFSRDVRPKASPALAVALDLRVSTDCSTNQAILPRAEKDGDRRSLHLLIQLQRKYGCGPNKRQDCNPCLRGSDALDNAIKAVKDRREPRTFSAKR
jgi:hypothetical protein